MGMEFPEPPDMEMMADEKRREKEAKENKKVLTEDDCWEYMILLQKYEPTEDDDGLRMILRNTLTGRHRMKKKVGSIKIDPHNNSPLVNRWDWDGDAYEV
jgi:hypothetical protein